jgi:UDP-glucuronate 4-epimerase
MRVLVTGGAGLIGLSLRPALAARGHQVTAVDITDFGRGDAELRMLELDDRRAMEAVIDAEAIEAIIHCAAISGPMFAKGEPLRIVAANIDLTALLLDVARMRGMRRFVFCSSIGAYGNAGTAIITEETPLRPTSIYGASKVAGEALVRAFHAEFGLSAVSLRPSRVYGPGRRANCFIRDMISDASAGRDTVLPCDPAFPFHYVYVADVASALIAALEVETLPSLEYNVDAGQPMTMPEIAAIARSVIPGVRIELVPGVDEVSDHQAGFDISRIGAELAWRPQFDLRRGIARYVEAARAESVI